jgi:hypothetical protein
MTNIKSKSLEMISEFFLNLSLIETSLPGAAGGCVAFLAGIKLGHYRNNKYVAKFSLELLGGATTASFVTLIVSPNAPPVKYFVAFAIGMSWAGIVQLIRTKITKFVEVVLGEKLGEH